MNDFTHFNNQGRARMVDISGKEETVRTAVARSSVHMAKETYEKIIKNGIKKGDVLGVAQIAGVMGAKQTAIIIPMCHSIQISGVDIRFDWINHGNEAELQLEAEVKTIGGTGVEMEALTAVTVSALTVYDMCKAVDRSIVIGPSFLLRKNGGKSGDYVRTEGVLLPAIDRH